MGIDASSTSTRPVRTARPLCAYSPRWLSGPTPAYEGLVATWDAQAEADDAPAGLHER